ncbi:hypothetical protein GGI11_004687 [Coemansia sp. RSA 2049]|nr:hypothetical protein GGI11_004687 [Coemansia sp. RSA 2049]
MSDNEVRPKRRFVLWSIQNMLKNPRIHLFRKGPSCFRTYKEGSVVYVGYSKSAPSLIESTYKALVNSVDPVCLPSLASVGDTPFGWSREDVVTASEQIRSLSDQLCVSDNNKQVTESILDTIGKYLRSNFSSAKPWPAIFGSRMYGLASDTTDVDICINFGTPDAGKKNKKEPTKKVSGKRVLFGLSKYLRRTPRFSLVTLIPHARVPIVKFQYSVEKIKGGPKLSCDVSAHSKDGIFKSEFLKAYLAIDPRVREFLVVLKVWAQQRSLVDSQTLNSFGFIMMGLTFLIHQRVVPPLQLVGTTEMDDKGWECLQALQSDPKAIADLLANGGDFTRCIQTGRNITDMQRKITKKGTMSKERYNCYFFDHGSKLSSWRSPNTKPVIQLLYEMFVLYGCKFDPLKHSVSPKLGSPFIVRTPEIDNLRSTPLPGDEVMSNPSQWAMGLRPLVVEDPFDPTNNCGRHVTCEWVDGMLWEMRRAAWMIHRHNSSSTGNGGENTATAANVIDRLVALPSADIFSDNKIWDSAYLHFGPIYRNATVKRINGENMRELDLDAADSGVAGNKR